MGQTGVGKSSMVNALFGSTLTTGAVRPVTKEPQEVRTQLGEGRSLVFVDLPGIGESRLSDSHYLDMYREELNNADIVLWLFSADNRALLTDVNCLAALRAQGTEDPRLLQKITFALTKSDLVVSPWVLTIDGVNAFFGLKSKDEQTVLDKAEFVRESLQETVSIEVPDVIPTSARFRYRLAELLFHFLKATDDATVARLGRVLNLDSLSQLPIQDALALRNFVTFDTRTNQTEDIARMYQGDPS